MPSKQVYTGIVGIPPPTDQVTIAQRENVVQDIYERLTQPDITAIVLTGIGGIGKSTLAALVYNYAKEQHHTSKGSFTAEPIWISFNPTVTHILIDSRDLVWNKNSATLVEAAGEPLCHFAA
jgi:hypothetical protein